MRQRPRHTTGIAVLTTALALFFGFAGQAAADSAGTVHFVRTADPAFAPFTDNPSAQTQAWMRAHFWRMTVFSPYFDGRTSWYGQGWVYDDAYAIYKGDSLESQHPEWILRDGAGNKLYIPYACSSGSCPQYAGDISNPAFRRYWIEGARARLAHGYRGLFVDDVDMEERVGNGEGQQVAPIDPHTGQPMPAASWRAYMAEFMAEIRAAFPSAEIVHNGIWFANSDAGTADPSIRREIESANYVYLERGVNDSGLTGGTGQWSLNALFAYIDQVHAIGRGVILDGAASDPHGMEYNLASYFLTSTGNDGVSGTGQTPENWWSGWNVNLGEASGARYAWSNVLRRDFAGGLVLVNPPGASTRTISLATPMRDVNGNAVSSVTLAAASGVVLSGTAPAPAPAPAPTSGAAASAISTQTILDTTPVSSHPSTGSARGGGASSTKSPARRGAPARRARRHVTHRHRHAHARQAARHGAGSPRHRVVLTRISGRVLRANQGTVAVQVEQRRGHRWVAVRHLTMGVGPRGRFARLLDLRAAARYRVRALYLGASGYSPSRSGYRIVVLGTR